MNYCNLCGHSLSLKIPPQDNRLRYICNHCDHIHYQNPRIIVCSLPCHEDKVLLCKRAIEPRSGLWTLPGGFLENGETSAEGAQRETLEEACARINSLALYGLYNLPDINQLHIFFRANLSDLNFSPGEESLEVGLFSEQEVPWENIAFTPVVDTLKRYFRDKETNQFNVHYADIIFKDKTPTNSNINIDQP